MQLSGVLLKAYVKQVLRI